MKLVSEDGTAVDLWISGYQYPDITAGGWDGNWLLVSGLVQREGAEWRFCDPCLTTWELQGLIEWLGTIGSGTPMQPLGFTEPNLSFTYEHQPQESICVRLSHEAVPPWADLGRQVQLRCPLAQNDPGSLVASLREGLGRYPTRSK